MTPRIRSTSLNKYSKVAPGLGIDPIRMLRQVGLDNSCLRSPDLYVPEPAFAQLLEVSAAQSGNASLGLLMGSLWRLSDFGLISLLLQHQHSLGALLQTLKDYRHLLSTTITVETVAMDRLSIIQLYLATEREKPGCDRMELTVTALLSLCRHQLGAEWNPVGVHFSHSPPPSIAHHRRIFRSDIVFGSGFDGIVVLNDDLWRLNLSHDSAMETYARSLIDMHAPKSPPQSIEHQVRSTIQSLLPQGNHGIAQVASVLGCTARSLQRQLESGRTSFQDTLDAVRSEVALRVLKNPEVPISEAASLAGFAENSSFTRWFNKHFQQSPTNWRQAYLRRLSA